MTYASDPVVIVGAGLAGLRCAITLTEAGIPILLLDALDKPGGRMRTDEYDGFKLDRGFQILLTAYPEAAAALDYGALDLHHFRPGALIRANGTFHQIADPRRNPGSILQTLGAPVGSLLDKARLGQMQFRLHRGQIDEVWKRPETTSLNHLRKKGFSSSIIDGFFRPFFSGVFLEPDLRTSSRMLEFLMKMFIDGESALPANGIEEIPRQLAAHLPERSMRFNARVESVEDDGVRLADGEFIRASSVVVATDGDSAAALLPQVIAPGFRGTACLYYAAEKAPIQDAMLVLDAERSGPLNNVAIVSNVSPLYAPPGAALISASTVGVPVVDDEKLDRASREQLFTWWGDQVRDWRLLRIYRIPRALPRQEPPALSMPRRPVHVRGSCFVCGDHRDNASINGALASGRRTAREVIARLNS